MDVWFDAATGRRYGVDERGRSYWIDPDPSVVPLSSSTAGPASGPDAGSRAGRPDTGLTIDLRDDPELARLLLGDTTAQRAATGGSHPAHSAARGAGGRRHAGRVTDAPLRTGGIASVGGSRAVARGTTSRGAASAGREWVRPVSWVVLTLVTGLTVGYLAGASRTDQAAASDSVSSVRASSRTPALATPGQGTSGQAASGQTVSPGSRRPTVLAGTGLYRVGVDVQPGQFRAMGSDHCYWARLPTDGRRAALGQGGGGGPQSVTIRTGDGGFVTSGCGTWRRS